VREHGEGGVPVPGVVAADLVLVEAGLVLRGLEALLDRYVGYPWCLIGLLLCDHLRCLTPLVDAVFY
jgi:hypothetical protein